MFDIGGVVVHTDFQKLYTNFATRIGISPSLVANYHKDYFDDLILGTKSLEDLWDNMETAGGAPRDNFKSIWLEEGAAVRTGDSNLIKLICKLRKSYSIGAVTNLTEDRLIIDEKTKLYANFDYKVLSCIEHIKKPDAKFYQLALSKASLSSKEAVFIDDKEVNVLGAESIGIHGIVYFGYNSLIASLQKLNIDL